MSTDGSRWSSRMAVVAQCARVLRADERGTVAIMMGALLPVLIGTLGLGFEVSYWYMTNRSMQNAADAAAIAAAINACSNYDVEPKAVAALYGFTNGSKNVTVTVSNTAACPSRSSKKSSPRRRSSSSERSSGECYWPLKSASGGAVSVTISRLCRSES